MFQGKMTADGNFPKMDFSRAFSKLCYLLPSKFQKLEFSSTQSRVSGKVTIRHKFQVKGGKYKDTYFYIFLCQWISLSLAVIQTLGLKGKLPLARCK